MMISSAEKGFCWLRLTRSGPTGHGSMPHGDNALEKLVQGINRILDRPNPVIITDVIAEYFKQMGEDWDFLKPYLEMPNAETLSKVLIESGVSEMPQISAMLRNTLSVNMIKAGAKDNVIPGSAEADLDIRVLPGVDPDDFAEELKQLAADTDIQFKIKSKYPATESAFDTAEFSLIKDACIDSFNDCLVVPSLLFGTSDSRLFRDRGALCYGVFPVMASMEDIKMVHGHNEKISTENMIRGTEVYMEIVKRLCII
jgi:acetylornithine deacetylase/succinyl-diaminopimelate desuccinylase-like protein